MDAEFGHELMLSYCGRVLHWEVWREIRQCLDEAATISEDRVMQLLVFNTFLRHASWKAATLRCS
jgi:hypothetical protein